MGRWIICYLLLSVLSRAADQPHLKGVWKGTEDVTVCGRAAGVKELTMVINDAPLKVAGLGPTVSARVVQGKEKTEWFLMNWDPKAAILTWNRTRSDLGRQYSIWTCPLF